MIVSLVVSIYLLIGLLIGHNAIRHGLEASRKYNNNEKLSKHELSTVDTLDEMTKSMSNKQIIISFYIIGMLFWFPLFAITMFKKFSRKQ